MINKQYSVETKPNAVTQGYIPILIITNYPSPIVINHEYATKTTMCPTTAILLFILLFIITIYLSLQGIALKNEPRVDMA